LGATLGRVPVRGSNDTILSGIRRAWALIEPATRKRLRAIGLFSILISVLDTGALLLVYGLITILSGVGQKPTSIVAWVIRFLGIEHLSRYGQALTLLAITAALFVTRSLLSVLNTWLQIGAVNSGQVGLLTRILTGYALSPQLSRLERNSSETLRTLAFSIDQVSAGVVGASVMIVANLAITVAVGVALFLSSPFVALTISVYFAVVTVAWTRGVRGIFKSRGESVQALQEERYRLIIQGLGAAKELQLRGRALFYATTAVGTTRKINAAMRSVGVLGNSVRNMLETSLVIGTVLVVAVAGMTGGRAATLPAVGLVLAAAFRLLPALNQAIYLANSVHYNLPAITLLEGELAGFERTRTATGEQSLERLEFRDELRLEHVSFRYPTRPRPALRDINLTLHPGEAIGVIGSTGAGKSTLLDIILGFLEPDEGEAILDGAPLRVKREGWQRSIGYVPQDVYLVDDTLRANIALGWRGDDIDDEAVLEAVRLAELEEVVASLPEKLETVLGERGVRFSGGQRQRVGIARALYTRPSVLVLDEATSNLDRPTEARIVDTLGRLAGGITMVIVTHRISAVQHCGRIVCLHDGMIRTSGTLAEVAASAPDLFGAGDTAGSKATVTAPRRD
jgi:ATP-binding cassette, subfamily B, bacterial PglK